MRFAVIPLLLISMNSLWGRQFSVLQPGDIVPGMTVSVWEKGHFVNREWDPSVDSLVILDFWATWCTSCIGGIEILDSLQRKFEGRVKIWLVNSVTTGDDTLKLDAYYTRWALKKRQELSLPTILNDTSLSAMFPHNEIPHVVWIYQGKFLALSDKASLKDSVVLRLLNEGKYDGYRKPQPVLFGTNDRLGSILFKKDTGFSYSLLTGQNEQLPVLVNRDWNRLPGYSTVTMLNQSLLALIKYAFMPGIPDNRVRVKGKTQLREKELTGRLSDLFCYEFRDTVSERRQLQRYIARDLERLFQFTARIVHRRDRCLYMKKIKQDAVQAEFDVADSMDVSELVFRLNVVSSLPVLVSPRISEQQYVRIKGWPGTEAEILPFLKAHGIDVRIKRRPMKQLLLETN